MDDTRYTITEIKRKRKKGWYVCVFRSGRSLDIFEDSLIAHSLFPGKQIDREALNGLQQEAERHAAQDSALHLLSYRLRSEKELKGRLRQKGIGKNTANEVVESLKSKRYINDAEFAISFARDIVRRRPSGALLIKTELKKKGIDGQTVDNVIIKIDAEYPPVDRAAVCAEEWLKRNQRVKKEERRTKLSRFLYQRGFTWAVIEDVLGDTGDID